MTSDEFLDLKEVPSSVAVVGGGAIGCEFASLLADLGAKVTVLEALESLLPGCDEDIVRLIARSFKRRGIDIVTGVQVEGHTPNPDGGITTLVAGDASYDVEAIVVSVGRRPRSEGLVAEGVASRLTPGASSSPTSTSAPPCPASGRWATWWPGPRNWPTWALPRPSWR